MKGSWWVDKMVQMLAELMVATKEHWLVEKMDFH